MLKLRLARLLELCSKNFTYSHFSINRSGALQAKKAGHVTENWSFTKYFKNIRNRCGKLFKNGPSKICGGQPLKNLKWYGLPAI